ncbi:unnamed protein product [Ambrosiozyma monospora]|uniref:Unnamed protein product n=1 Tax=Ambrosiozyma monospora TaxID=43982 RepID=A0ACB5TB35_AMBMO|nr:unnamed protein product [Ambrosiozyma monospora]
MLLKTPTSYHQQQLQTPEQTPRVPQQRRKELSEAISFDSASSSSTLLPTPQTLAYNNALLFPVAHSTVGSGRRVGYSKPGSDFIKLDVKKSRLITKQDDESMSSATSSDEESDDESAPVEVQLRKVSKQLDFSVCMEEEEDELLQVPGTPTGQILDEERVLELGVQEKPLFSEIDSPMEFNIKKQELENPFLETSSVGSSRNKKDLRLSTVDFENEMEFVNFRTGERIIKPLDSFQKSIKPKILDFNVKDEDDEDDFEVPTTPTNNVKMNPLNIKPLKRRDLIGKNEVIKKVKPANPFFMTRNTRNRLERQKSLSPPTSASYKSTLHFVDSKGHKDALTERMDEEQLDFKPKKLNFDNC